MKRHNYLLVKLAEEAAEVAQAALKHRIKDTAKSRRRLESEYGDLWAIIRACIEAGFMNSWSVYDAMKKREQREEAKRGRK